MSRENPRPVPPAFDDLRHLRRHTPGGWLIVHPLLHHPVPVRAARPAVPKPPGYVTTRALCAAFGLGPRTVRRIVRGLRAVRVATDGTQPCNAYPAAAARRRLTRAAELRSLPTSPPPGHITARQAMQLLQCSLSSLTRLTKGNLLHPIPGRNSSNTRSLLYYPLAEVDSLRTRRINTHRQQLAQLHAPLP